MLSHGVCLTVSHTTANTHTTYALMKTTHTYTQSNKEMFSNVYTFRCFADSSTV